MIRAPRCPPLPPLRRSSSRLYLRRSAIDKQLDASDETGIPGGQEECGRCDLARLADASHRDDRDELILDLLWNAGEHAGIDGARADHIHPDVPILEVGSPGARERADGRLARVVNAQAREALRAGDGAGHDDRATVPHQRQGLLNREQRAPDVECVVEIRLGNRAKRNIEVAVAGAGVENGRSYPSSP
jgi:hypothetical protein